MWIFSKIFEKKRDNEEINEEEKRPKRRGDKKKALASAALMLMLLVSIYAEPASAGFGEWWGEKVDSITSYFREHRGQAIAIGLIIGGLIAAPVSGGASGLLTLKGLAVLGATSLGTYGMLTDWDLLPDTGDTGGGGGGYTIDDYADEDDITNDKDQLENVGTVDDVNQVAYQKIAEISAKLRSDLVKYDTKEEGATGDLWIKIYGPETIYGFSAFPVQVKLYTQKRDIPFSYVHLRSVSIYLKKENSTVQLWKRTWDYGVGSEGLNGESAVYTTILKVPDDYVSEIEQAISTGLLTKELVEKVFNATTETWEIFVEVDAYREIWQSDPSITDPSQCNDSTHKWDSETNTCYVFVRNADIDYTAYTTSAWKHVSMGKDVGVLDEGFFATLHPKFLNTPDATKWAIYRERWAGALSNLFIITYAKPVHVIGSTADYKFVIAPNPDYFNPLTPTFEDDFRFVVVRKYIDGEWTIADSIFGALGTLTDESQAVPKSLVAYYTEDPTALTYEVYALALFTIHRDDGAPIKVWLIVKPKVSVLDNMRVVLADNQTAQITQFTADGKLTEDDISQIRQMATAWIEGLNEKITTAQQLKEKADAEKNDKASLYAKKSIEAYQDAISVLQKTMQTDDVQMLLNFVNAAKKLEQAGDFYLSAAEKALYGEYEQAELDAQMGDELTELANRYLPRFDIANALSTLDWKSVLIIVALIAAGYLVFGRIGAIGGFILGLIVVFGPIVVEWLESLLDKIGL